MTEAATALRDDAYLRSLRRDMLRFAELQLRDRHQAEDAVQEALASALAHVDRFGSRAALKTWVLTILRNKIIDVFRQRAVRAEQPLAEEGLGDERDIDGHFQPDGHWREDARPAAWGDPQQALASRQFWHVFEACLHRLADAPARAFMMRELLGLDTDEICRELGITQNHCGVVMHRARLSLRACLGEGWFAQEGRA